MKKMKNNVVYVTHLAIIARVQVMNNVHVKKKNVMGKKEVNVHNSNKKLMNLRVYLHANPFQDIIVNIVKMVKSKKDQNQVFNVMEIARDVMDLKQINV